MTLRDKVSHPFTPSLVTVKIPKDVIPKTILEYNGEEDPIQHINKHEVSLLGRTHNDAI